MFLSEARIVAQKRWCWRDRNRPMDKLPSRKLKNLRGSWQDIAMNTAPRLDVVGGELPLNVNFRHSRVGGNPISLRHHDLLKTWIPAYAGMTGK